MVDIFWGFGDFRSIFAEIRAIAQFMTLEKSRPRKAMERASSSRSTTPPLYKSGATGLDMTNYQLPITNSQFPIPNSQFPTCVISVLGLPT
ncbi:hypothetical protein [Microcoleus vaginatus]|uniref:hypothetical protein n=1 Tax=Microcoleus vaginatus TaxID=119532 RepID=UPI0002F35EA1